MKLKIFALILLMTTLFSVAFHCSAYNDDPSNGIVASNSHESSSTIDSGEKAQYGIVHANLTIYYTASQNAISFSYNTIATHVSSQIGMSYLALEKWNANTQKWDTVVSFPEYEYNTISSMNGYIQYNVTRNAYYRVRGTHYAKINGTVYSLPNQTNSIYTN